MANLALRKRIEEEHYKGASSVTDGQITGYTGVSGFCEFEWPNYLTVDLENVCQIKCLRFLLWDNLGSGGTRAPRRYFYRVLTSIDHRAWDVIFDNSKDGVNGWQKLNFPTPIEARYIRIHGLWNSDKNNFHIVEFEAHDSEPPNIDAEYTLERTINIPADQSENGDALPIEHTAQILIKKLEVLLEKHNILNPEPIKSVISQLRIQVKDVSSIERNLESIRREITEPVSKELKKSSELGQLSVKLGKFSFWGFWVGLIGGILAIVSLLLNIKILLP